MVWIWLLICIVATVRLHGSPLFMVALLVSVANLWSLGNMHDFKDEPPHTHRGTIAINMLSTLAGIALLIASFATSK